MRSSDCTWMSFVGVIRLIVRSFYTELICLSGISTMPVFRELGIVFGTSGIAERYVEEEHGQVTEDLSVAVWCCTDDDTLVKWGRNPTRTSAKLKARSETTTRLPGTRLDCTSPNHLIRWIG